MLVKSITKHDHKTILVPSSINIDSVKRVLSLTSSIKTCDKENAKCFDETERGAMYIMFLRG